MLKRATTLCLLLVVALVESARKPQMMGGWSKMAEANEDVREMAKWSVAEFAETGADEYQSAEIQRIRNIRWQVVSKVAKYLKRFLALF